MNLKAYDFYNSLLVEFQGHIHVGSEHESAGITWGSYDKKMDGKCDHLGITTIEHGGVSVN